MIQYGGFSIDKAEGAEILRCVRDLGAKSVLEFGAGMSTLVLTGELGKSAVWSFEDHPETLADLLTYQVCRRDMSREYTPAMLSADRALFKRERFDLAFVDGPPAFSPAHLFNGCARYWSVFAAKQFADAILMHDTERDGEKATIRALLSSWTRTDYASARGLSLFRKTQEVRRVRK